MINNLSLGKVIEDMYFAYHIKTEYPKCPLYGSSIFPHTAALPHRDNKTYTCRDCGQGEAVQDLSGYKNKSEWLREKMRNEIKLIKR